MQIGLPILLAFGSVLIVIAFILTIRARYKIFTNRDFVLHFRKGKLVSENYGGAVFLFPFIDELIVLSTTVQELTIDAGEVITKENQDVKIKGFIVWRIEAPIKAYQSMHGSNNNISVMQAIDHILNDIGESIIRTTVAQLTLDQVLRERSLIIEAILEEMVKVVMPMGIQINTAEIRHVEVVDKNLFNDLQEDYRQSTRLAAERQVIDTNQEIAKQNAYSEQQVKLFTAQQEEQARTRELEKDRKVLESEQKLNEAEQIRQKSVQELAMQKELSVAKIQKDKLKVEAETQLMQIELDAEAKKRRHILEQIEVQAQERKLMAEAEAEAIKMQADANLEAAHKDAEAEAFKLEKVAEAKKAALLAEAEGRKAVLLAEAEGLREKVKAEGMVNEAMIMQELVKQLPAIASSIKVGDISWLNMGGEKDGKGGSPLGIIPKNLLEILTLSKSFGLDIEGLIKSIRGKETNGHTEIKPEETKALMPVIEEKAN